MSGDVKVYQCKKCRKFFSFGPKTRRIKYSAETIFTALQMERHFNTNRQISDFLINVRKVNATNKMVGQWRRKAREKIKKNRGWQRALEKNSDAALHGIAEIIAKDLQRE